MRNCIFLLRLDLLRQAPEMRLKIAKKLLILADFKLIGLLKNREVFFSLCGSAVDCEVAEIFENKKVSWTKMELFMIKYVQSFVFFERYSVVQHNSESSGSSLQSHYGSDLYLSYCSIRK